MPWSPRASANPKAGATPEPLFTNATSLGGVLESIQQAGPRGTLLVRDEQGGWLAHMARGTRDGSAHAFWLAGWCQRSLDFGWRGQTVELDRPALSILGTAHPAALAPALARDDGGVLARFLFVRPPPAERRWPLPQTDSLTPEAAAALQRLCRWSGSEQILPLTPEALAVFEHFGRANTAARSDLAGKAAAWWGKGPSQVLRLAGVLTLLDWAAQPRDTAEPRQVPARAVEAAARLWRDHLWPHAQATFGIAGTGAEGEDRKRQVLRWLRKRGQPKVSREQLRREALLQALNAAGTDRLIEALAEGGWLLEAAPASGRRGRRARRWHVHPDLLGAKDLAVGEAVNGRAGDGSDRVAPATLFFCDGGHERRWSDAVRPVTSDADVLHRHREEAEDDLAVPRDAISAIPAVESGDRATPLAATQPGLDAATAVPAIPASDSNAPATALDEVEHTAPGAHGASSGSSAGIPDASTGAPPEGGVAAAAAHPAVPAISASDSDTAAMTPAPTTDHAVEARDSAKGAPGNALAGPSGCATADRRATISAISATESDSARLPRLNARARRRLRRDEKRASLGTRFDQALAAA